MDDYWLLNDVMFLISVDISNNLAMYGKRGGGVLVVGSFSDRTRFDAHKTTKRCTSASEIHEAAMSLFDGIPFRPVRRIGISVYNLVRSTRARPRSTR